VEVRESMTLNSLLPTLPGVNISSVLFLGDRVTPKLIVGRLLAISGVGITQVRSTARSI
jgi:drug/metabolite transporter (DMT)-like permease